MSRSKQIWVNVPEAFSVPTILAPPVQSWSDRLRILVVLSIERMRGAKAARLAQLPPDMILALVQHTTIVPESRYACSLNTTGALIKVAVARSCANPGSSYALILSSSSRG